METIQAIPRPAPAARPSRVRCSRRAGWAALAACALGLAGCGASLIYPRLDTLVGFYIEGLVDLDASQRSQLQATLRGNLDWHRRTELTRYEASLVTLSRAIADGAQRDEIEAALDRGVDYWRDIWVQAAPGYTRLALTFSDAQVDELLRSLAERDDEEWQDHQRQTPAARQAQTAKSLRRNIEHFTGRLDDSQRALITRYAAIDRGFKPLWQLNRRIWRDALGRALRARADTPQFRERMDQLIARPDELWTPEYRRAIAANRKDFVDLLLALDATLTPQQRRSLQKELLSLAEEVRNLARGAG